MDMMRHVAKVANTDQRCVVAYMQIPRREDHALVIPVDNLPPRFEQAVMQVLKTPEGQQAETFADALHRHRMPDTGDNILEALHKAGKLVPVPVANVLMLPRPNQPVKLSYILEQLGRMPKPTFDPMQDKFNPHTHNQQASASQNSRMIAQNILVEAEMLELEARKKRELAYSKDPSLRNSKDAAVISTMPMETKVIPIANSLESFFSNQPTEMEPPAPEPEPGPSPLELRMQALEESLTRLVQHLANDTAKKDEVEPERAAPKKRTLKEESSTDV
jgi:hypothetical protein